MTQSVVFTIYPLLAPDSDSGYVRTARQRKKEPDSIEFIKKKQTKVKDIYL
jgi:hypothetical protein